MVQKYWFFWFDESNFASERARLLDFFGGGVNVQCLREFPPCVLGEKCDIKSVDKEIVLSDNDFLVGHNLFFGKDFVEINKRFKDSPFISSKCKECEHFKSFFCRGLFNKKFLDIKDEIIKKRGKEQYNALILDYSYGFFGLTSDCNLNCYFCGSDLKSESFFIYIHPPLLIKEFIHFLHYIPSYGVDSSMFRIRCLSGEPLMHKDIKEILKISKFFALKKCSIVTNGHFLDDSLLDLISKLGYEIFLSLHTVNKDLRKKMMGYKDDFDIKGLIKKILDKKISLTPSIVALKENIANGDLKETITYLKEHGLKALILANVCALDWEKDKIENLNYDDDFLIKYLKDEGLYDSVEMVCEMGGVLLSDFIGFFKDYINKFKGNKILILAPQKSYNGLKAALKDFKNIYVKGLDADLGLNRTISCSLTVDVFLEALSKTDYEYDLLIIPKQSFDSLMKDVRGTGINKLVSKIDKKVVLVG